MTREVRLLPPRNSSVISAHDPERSTTTRMGTDDEQDALIDIPSTVSAGANVVGMHNYLAVWEKSVNDPQAFWMEQACPPLLRKPHPHRLRGR